MEREYYVYATQTTTLRSIVMATSEEDANKKALETAEPWSEVGELEWENVPSMTEEV